MKKPFFLLFSVLLGATASRATNISIADSGNAGATNPVVFNNGSSLPNGAITVRIGYFNTTSQGASWLSDLQSTDLSKIQSALASFIPLGEDSTKPVLGNLPAGGAPRVANRPVNLVATDGRITGGVADVTPVAGTPNTANAGGVPAGSRIFLLVYSDNNAVLNDGEQFGVFSADTWLINSDGSLPLQLNTIGVNTASEVYRGTYTGNGNENGNVGTLRLALVGVVPEPTTAAMGLLAGLGLMARRRR